MFAPYEDFDKVMEVLRGHFQQERIPGLLSTEAQASDWWLSSHCSNMGLLGKSGTLTNCHSGRKARLGACSRHVGGHLTHFLTVLTFYLIPCICQSYALFSHIFTGSSYWSTLTPGYLQSWSILFPLFLFLHRIWSSEKCGDAGM